ncbi:MAG: cobalamin biosynthesis protein CobD [Chloroflexi bacterium]|jgi:adenosylcobinamide-phosphate synthase|uniref:Cobalamin biosynthesis protein CobD n=1 Tax=Candidatus Thermofonsia Clade 3 bacterium TaxID=2364212 RepID=A0A2M8QA61_9CHLR|nr:adenosylcobinamide-phosphate synthase CbiB [Candidatus Roseilinea sp. NK_OTU-006]PJF46681.1 MAG: cobalamin biosynthesis protein CobD [Candidatus Thermofonsia Clade 3 bacterium]RMG62864.1 MAG: cobalamin biosynthesis protein CobD [Chloroflexota bacterium]
MVIPTAFALDVLLGEPPARLHPVVWMGGYLRHMQRRLPARFLAGALAWWGGALLFAGGAWLVQSALLAALPPAASAVALAVMLKPLFAWRGLRAAALEILRADAPAERRRLLSWHLVSRDTRDLSAGEVNGATIESLAENLSDSLVAPLFWFVVGGLPLAALYRFANTADAMWGYRTPELEWFGKWAARADDALNFIPARLTALLLLTTAWLLRLDARSAWRVWRRDGRRTPSPNAGQPMSVAAGALRVNLTKRNLYSLGAEFPLPADEDVHRALRWCSVAAWTWVVIAGAVELAMQMGGLQ